MITDEADGFRGGFDVEPFQVIVVLIGIVIGC